GGATDDSVLAGYNTEVTAPARLGGRPLRGLLRLGTTRLAHGLRQRGQLVTGGLRSTELALVTHHLPALRHGETLRVLFTQVIGVWFHRCRQRADHGGRIPVGVSQGGHSGLETARPRTLPYATHAADHSASHRVRCVGTPRDVKSVLLGTVTRSDYR